MYRRSKQARLLTGGLIGALPVTTPGDEYWNDVSLLIRGDTLTDLSSNAHTLTAYGNAAAGDTDPVKFASGSLTFDGTGDYIDLDNVDVLDIAGGNWTIEAWVYTAELSNYQMIASYGGGVAAWNGTDGHNWNFFYGTSVAYIQYWKGSARQDVTAAHGMSPNTWNHIAVSYDGTTVRLFINGSVIASSTASPAAISDPLNSAATVIGDTASFDTPLQGNIEDFRVTKGVARYTSNFTPPTASLPTNAPVVGRRGVGTEATLRTRGYVGAAPALAVDTFYYWSQTIADLYASITLSNGGATATSSGGSGRSAFGDLVVTTGKWYYEVRGNDNSVGWSTQDEAHRVRYDSGGVFTYTDTGGTTTDTGNATYGTSAIIGCAWDADTGVATFYKDGVLQGSISGGSAGQEMRAKFNGTSSVSRSARINVGQDATFDGAVSPSTTYTDANDLGEFYYEPPAGFVGLYTTTGSNGGMLTLYDRYIDTLT